MKKLVVIFVMTSLFISIFAGCNVELQNGVETQSTDVTEYEAEYAIESIVGTEEEESQKGDEATEVESEIEAETEIDCEQNTENEAEIAVDETQKLEQDQNSQNADTSGSDINSNTNNNNNSNNNSSNGNCNNDNGNNNYNASESSDEVRKKAKAVIAEITNASMSDLEKALAIYNWMAKNIEYDMEGYLSGSISLECFSAYGALFDGLAVCDGYARTFIVLAEEAGLGVKYVSGLANNGETFGSHAWNQVEIDGVWYNVDITWDDVGNEIFFDYFLLSNDDMLKDHFPDIIGVDYANCPETYRRNVIIKTANKTL